ncbi:MAG: NAD(P)H-hydrate dehydratase [Helicobacteraceae bacterium]|nr:NAD(P)H-hydrate dehydratase [Helicobacteraceae bacterium]
MQNIYTEVNSLDRRCCEKFFLDENILMEHASSAISKFIENKFEKNSKVLIVCGSGNNGADGIALARLLHKNFQVKLYMPFELKSPMSKVQLQRSTAVGVEVVDEIIECDVVVDALFGSGLSRFLDESSTKLLKQMNSLKAYKIACDISSGILNDGECDCNSFKAQTTITMGALKLSMFSDSAKEYVGNIEVAELGVAHEIYEIDSDIKLLDLSDLKLPMRTEKSSHKGSFGHLTVLSGEKVGASVIAGTSALNFGVGLVTLVSERVTDIPFSLMSSSTLPTNTTAIALGMGLGTELNRELLNNKLPLILDADIFSNEYILELLKRENIVITPHPKEFTTLLKKCNIADISVNELQKNRFKYVKLFNEKYPHIVLLLKGANVIISHNEKMFINPHGTQALAKGGSGDVLSGLIGSLLAQGQEPLDATINGSLAHTLCAIKFKKNNYALTPEELIEQLKTL